MTEPLIWLPDAEMIEASLIYPNLWQGSKPNGGPFLAKENFSLLVLCAEEYQPPAEIFHKVRVVYAPNDDDPHRPPSKEELRIALDAATQAAAALRLNQKVLVTCQMGINRSGLVTGLTLHKLLSISGMEACAMIKQARPWALTNPQFVQCLARIP